MGDAAASRQATATEPIPRLPSEVWVLVVVSFIIAMGFSLVAPALTIFARSFDVSVTAASALISAFALMRLCFAPVSGKLVTSLGERPIYLAGILVVGLSTGAAAFAQSYWQLLLFRGLGGIGSTMFTVSAFGLLVRLAPPEQRGRASGLFMTSFLVGNIIGPVFGGGLLAINLRLPFLVYAVALMVAACVAWVLLRNSELAAPERSADVAPVTLRHALRHRAYQAGLVANFAKGWLVLGIRVSLVPLFVVDVLRQDVGWTGIALAVFSVGTVAVLTLSGRLADTLGRKPLIVAGLLVSAGGTVWLGYSEQLTMFLVASLVTGVGVGMVQPSLGATVADVIGSRARGGTVLAGFQMAADFGVVVGPIFAGLLVDAVSYRIAFIVTGIISLLALPLWLRAPETLGERERSAHVSTT
ncbi:MAG: MFS transporter [Pseudonocardiaceae bacterium]|nr:MFS transporter [Pseudonocardiaceae bacterium]